LVADPGEPRRDEPITARPRGRCVSTLETCEEAFMAFGNSRSQRGLLLRALALTAMLVLGTVAVRGQQDKLDVLRIGTSRTLTPEGGDRNEKSSLDTLRGFIKEETGLDSEVVREKNWQELAAKMSKGDPQVGVFQGFEYALAQEKYPDLKPLAVSVNIYVYPVAYVVAGRDNKATNFAGLQGQSLALLTNGPGFLDRYIEQQCQMAGKKPEAFFSKIVKRDNFEDVIDDVVDGQANAGVADRAALEAYKRRKPGRFKQLKQVAQSDPFPPAVVAHYGKFLDEARLRQFREGLLNASAKEKGQTMLTLFRLTAFEPPPADFDKVLAATRKAYPATDTNGDKGK
jgi:ABC-type phosphate/phosphonate transport system substrate-binding protein